MNKKLNILNVDSLLDPVTGGGTAERSFQMSRYLVKAGAKCTVLTTNIGMTPTRIANMQGVDVVAFPCLNRRFYVPRFSFNTIENIVKQADIVHLMSHWTLLNVLAYHAVRKYHKPYVVCPAGALPLFGRSIMIKRIYNVLVGKSIIQNANRFIAIAENEIPQFMSYGGDNKKVILIPNGISEEEFQARDDVEFRRKYNLPANPFILFVGRLNPIKGPDLLLKAFLQLREEVGGFHLLFVGPDGGLGAELKRIVAKHHAEDRVHFIGYLAGEEKSQVYHAAEFLVIPSRQEAMSIVAVEAGVTGTPVLLTDKCGFNHIADIGGGLVVAASEDGLLKGLRKLLAKPSDLTSMGLKLQQYVRENFRWEVIIHNFLTLYEQILRTG